MLRRTLASSIEDLMVFTCFGSDDPQHSHPRGFDEPLGLCPRRWGIPSVAMTMYYLLIDYPNCAPSPNGGLHFKES